MNISGKLFYFIEILSVAMTTCNASETFSIHCVRNAWCRQLDSRERSNFIQTCELQTSSKIVNANSNIIFIMRKYVIEPRHYFL